MYRSASLLAAMLLAAGAAQAQNNASGAGSGQVYGGVGLPGLLTLGYAQPMGENWGLRAEVAGGLSANKDGQREGLNYNGKLRSNRIGLYGDWFPAGSGFRVTGGLTLNDTRFNLHADAGNNSGIVTINGTPVPVNPADRLDIKIYQPRVTPYIGIGYGLGAQQEKGWSFNGEVGLMLGKFKTSYSETLSANHPLLISANDVAAEVDKVRKDVNKLSVMPTITVGVSYKF